MPAQELKQEMSKINFYPGHRQIGDVFYQTLSLVYLIGLYKSDTLLRLASLMLMSGRLWNGMVKKFFPLGCDSDTARYVQQYIIQNNSEYKKYGSPYSYVANHLALRIDKTYSEYVRQDAANPKTGLVKLIKTLQPTLQSLFQGTLTKHYYPAFDKGLKETSVSTHGNAYDNDGDMIESRETFKTFLDQILDKFEKNMILNFDLLLQPDIKNAL